MCNLGCALVLLPYFRDCSAVLDAATDGGAAQFDDVVALCDAAICAQHGSWDGSACVCHDNFIGALCDQSCGDHGTASADGSACICVTGYGGRLCSISLSVVPDCYSPSYVISGSSDISSSMSDSSEFHSTGNLDGTYSLVEAHCSRPHPGLWLLCDTGSPTTCGGDPVFQRGGKDGPVLFNFDAGAGWIVADSSALADCVGIGLNPYASRPQSINNTALDVYRAEPKWAKDDCFFTFAPDDDVAFGAWHQQCDHQGCAYASPMTISAGVWQAPLCHDNFFGKLCDQRCGDHSKGSADESACVCDAGYAGKLCQIDLSFPGFSQQYVVSGSRGASAFGNLDGTYSLVEAHCSESSVCDGGSPTTCNNGPVFQKGGAQGPVLYRHTIHDGLFGPAYSQWSVGDSSVLANCDGDPNCGIGRDCNCDGTPNGGSQSCTSPSLESRVAEATAKTPGPPDDATYGAWQEFASFGKDGFVNWQDSPLAIVVGGGR